MDQRMNLPEIEESVMPWIGKTGKMMAAYAIDKFKQHKLNLTIEQWVTLKMLYQEDGRIQNDLALITNRNKTSLTRLINTMEKNNLVARIADKVDKRANRIYLTRNGKKVFASTMKIMEECITELEEGLSDQEIQTLIKILKKVQNNIKVVPQTNSK